MGGRVKGRATVGPGARDSMFTWHNETAVVQWTLVDSGLGDRRMVGLRWSDGPFTSWRDQLPASVRWGDAAEARSLQSELVPAPSVAPPALLLPPPIGAPAARTKVRWKSADGDWPMRSVWDPVLS